jgi:hypothetical protein
MKGVGLPEPGKPAPEVVALAEKLLELARSGEIIGLIAVYLHSDMATDAAMDGQMQMNMVGRVEAVKMQLLELLLK